MWRGERGHGDAPPTIGDSAVSPCFHGCLAFLHRHFPPRSPPSHPLDPSLHSQQLRSPWDCSTIPKCQLPAAAPSRGPVSWPGCVWLQQGLSDSHSFRRPQVSCFRLSLKCFSPDSDNHPAVGIGPLLQSPTKGRSSPTNTPVFPPCSFHHWVLRGLAYRPFPLVRSSCPSQRAFCVHFCVWIVFLMYPWREVCSTSPTPLLSCSLCSTSSLSIHSSISVKEKMLHEFKPLFLEACHQHEWPNLWSQFSCLQLTTWSYCEWDISFNVISRIFSLICKTIIHSYISLGRLKSLEALIRQLKQENWSLKENVKITENPFTTYEVTMI